MQFPPWKSLILVTLSISFLSPLFGRLISLWFTPVIYLFLLLTCVLYDMFIFQTFFNPLRKLPGPKVRPSLL